MYCGWGEEEGGEEEVVVVVVEVMIIGDNHSCACGVIVSCSS